METTPFVHLLKSPYHHYAYDVNTNSIVSISKELFNYLRSIENSGASIPDNNPPQKVDLEIKRLKEQGYVKEKRPAKIENPVIDYLPYLLENHLGQLILQVTQQCNFRCSYCPYTIEEGETTRNHSNKRMSWEIAKAAIDFYKEHTRDSKILYISFYGGEPLLEWSLIKRC